MSKTSGSGGSIFLLQLSVGILFLVIGILGLSGETSGFGAMINNMNRFLGVQGKIIPTIISILQLAAGLFLLLDLFNLVRLGATKTLVLIILILWIVNMVFAHILGNSLFDPSFLAWLGALAPNLVVLASLWIIYEGK